MVVSTVTSASRRDFIVNQMPNLFIQACSFIIGLIVMLIISPLMALFVFVPIPFVVFLVSKFWAFVQKRNRRLWVLGQRTNHLLQDILNGIRVVKCFGREKAEIDRFKDGVGQAREPERSQREDL